MKNIKKIQRILRKYFHEDKKVAMFFYEDKNVQMKDKEFFALEIGKYMFKREKKLTDFNLCCLINHF